MKTSQKILLLLIVLAFFYYFICNSKGSPKTDSSKQYPLNIGKDMNESLNSSFSNISKSYFSDGPSGPSGSPENPETALVDIKNEITNKNETNPIALSKYPSGKIISNLIDDKSVPTNHYPGGNNFNEFYKIGYMIMIYNQNSYFKSITGTYDRLPDYPSDIGIIKKWITGLEANVYNALSYIIGSLAILNNKYIFDSIKYYIKNDNGNTFLKKIQLSNLMVFII